jgi:hypothetical protein
VWEGASRISWRCPTLGNPNAEVATNFRPSYGLDERLYQVQTIAGEEHFSPTGYRTIRQRSPVGSTISQVLVPDNSENSQMTSHTLMLIPQTPAGIDNPEHLHIIMITAFGSSSTLSQLRVSLDKHGINGEPVKPIVDIRCSTPPWPRDAHRG